MIKNKRNYCLYEIKIELTICNIFSGILLCMNNIINSKEKIDFDKLQINVYNFTFVSDIIFELFTNL